MSADLLIEKRLTEVEAAINAIQRRLASQDTPETDWVERFTGAFKDEPAFDEVVSLGRAIRLEDQPEPGDES